MAAIPPNQARERAHHRSFASMRTIMALTLREMSTRYGRSVGGYIWAILEPMGTIIMFALGFSLLLQSPSLGNSFIFFYATGYLPFHLYQQISLMVARAIVFSRPLLAYPTVSWIDTLLARFALNALTGIMVGYLIFAGLLLVSESRMQLDFIAILTGTGLVMILGFGIGSLNCALMGLFPTWDIVWSILTRPLFLASGIFFIYEDMPRVAQSFLWYNPLVHITGIMRQGFFTTYTPEYVSIPYVMAISLLTTAAGLLLLHRHHRDILQNG